MPNAKKNNTEGKYNHILFTGILQFVIKHHQWMRAREKDMHVILPQKVSPLTEIINDCVLAVALQGQRRS